MSAAYSLRNTHYSVPYVRQRNNFPDNSGLYTGIPFHGSLRHIAFIRPEKCVFCFSYCSYPNCNRPSFSDPHCTSHKFFGKSSHTFHPILDWTVFRIRISGQITSKVPQIKRNLLQTGTESDFHLFPVTYILFFAWGCCQFISWRCKDTFSILFDRRRSGNHSGRSIVNDTWLQHHRTRIAFILAFSFIDGSHGGHIFPIIFT